MNCIKYLLFGYGFNVIDRSRNINYPGNLPESTIPDLGVKNDLGNLILKFNDNWEKEPKDNPDMWRVMARTLSFDLVILHFVMLFSIIARFANAYTSE